MNLSQFWVTIACRNHLTRRIPASQNYERAPFSTIDGKIVLVDLNFTTRNTRVSHTVEHELDVASSTVMNEDDVIHRFGVSNKYAVEYILEVPSVRKNFKQCIVPNEHNDIIRTNGANTLEDPPDVPYNSDTNEDAVTRTLDVLNNHTVEYTLDVQSDANSFKRWIVRNEGIVEYTSDVPSDIIDKWDIVPYTFNVRSERYTPNVTDAGRSVSCLCNITDPTEKCKRTHSLCTYRLLPIVSFI